VSTLGEVSAQLYVVVRRIGDARRHLVQAASLIEESV
jgi:hypothetical protein